MYIMMPFLYVHCTVNIVGLGTYHTISCVFTQPYTIHTLCIGLIVGYLSWNLYHNCDMRSSINS